jgi:hypothetical protein
MATATLEQYGCILPSPVKEHRVPRVLKTGSFDEDHYYDLDNDLRVFVQEEGEYVTIEDMNQPTGRFDGKQLLYGHLDGYIPAKTIADKVVFGYIVRVPGERIESIRDNKGKIIKFIDVHKGQKDLIAHILFIRDKKYVDNEKSKWQPIGAQVRLVVKGWEN